MSRKRPASARAFFCLVAIVAVPAEPVNAVSPLLDGLRSGCASGLATVCAKAMLQPFDTIKTLQQANTGKLPQGMLQTATTLVNERGAVSLYRGLGVALLGSVPAMSVYFAVYQSCKLKLHAYPRLQARRMLIVVLSAAFANTFAATLRVPCELVKQRLQAGVYASLPAAWQALRVAGPRGLYVPGALSAQLSRDIPFGVIMFLAYESMRGALQRRYGGEPTPFLGALCGALAGSVATLATNPMDVLKTRIMTGGASGGQLLAAASSMLSAEGPGAFYAGLLPRLLHKTPAAGLFWLLFETFKRLLGAA